MLPVASSKTMAVLPEMDVFSTLRPSPSDFAVTGMPLERAKAPRGAPAPAPSASAPDQAGSLRAMTLSRTTRCVAPLRSFHSTATEVPFAPANAASSTCRMTR